MTDNTYYLNMAKNVLMEIKKSVVGKDEVICKIMMAILARGHVLIEDIPGVGKKTMALAIAEMLDSIPILTRRIGFRHGLGLMVISIAMGKAVGSLLYFWHPIFRYKFRYK